MVLGAEAVRTVTVTNAGRGDLSLDEIVLEGDEAFEALEPETRWLEPSGRLDLTVVFRPELPGPYGGRLELATNDPDRPSVGLAVEGAGTRPRIAVEPETISFGWVRAGGLATRTLSIESGGSGALHVRELVLDDPLLEDAFGFGLPGSGPSAIAAGERMVVVVVFRPPDHGRYDGLLEVRSDAVNPDDGFVRLVGNGVSDPSTNAPPLVEILSPTDGAAVLAGHDVQVVAATFDEEDEPAARLATLRVDGALVDTGVPGADGIVAFPLVPGSGTSRIEVTVVDSGGASGVDAVQIELLDPDERAAFVISGGSDPDEPFAVDDDLRIEVDGVTVFEDADGGRNTLAPVSFEATLASEIRLVATDRQYCQASIDALFLHSARLGARRLNPTHCRSACTEDACYDAAFDGPWPAVFLDETYPVVP